MKNTSYDQLQSAEQRKKRRNWQPVPADNLCEAVTLEWRDDKTPDFEPLIERMRAANAARGAMTRRPGVARAGVPFRDVVLKGPNEPDHALARQLKITFDTEFASSGVELAVHSAQDASMTSTIAYYGYGVFAPVRSDVRVADLEFSWVGPQADVIHPKLGAVSGSQDAGWYAGQNGIVLGFSGDPAPATLPLPAGASDAFRDSLAQAVLFVGRRNRASLPKIELHPVVQGEFVAYATAGEDWWQRRDGEWQPLRLTIGHETHPLWIRLTNRTGCIRFSPFPAPAGMPAVIVRGLLLPTVKFWHPLLTGSARRWLIHFDSQSHLRGSEVADTATSVVCDPFVRFAVYHHHDSGWSGLRDAFDGRRNLPLGQGFRVEQRPFPKGLFFSRDPKANAGAEKQYRKIYGTRDWTLVTVSDFGELGHFDVAGGDVSGMPENDGGLIQPPVAKIGFDWINRAAQVVVSRQVVGLAEVLVPLAYGLGGGQGARPPHDRDAPTRGEARGVHHQSWRTRRNRTALCRIPVP